MSEAEGPWLVAGLGNPGPEYAGNRHNIGFMVADVLAGGSVAGSRRTRAGRRWWRGGSAGQRVVLAKPMTFMNLSGGPVTGLRDFYKVSADRILAVHDELDIDYPTLRLKRGGGDNGHNGLKSITKSLGPDYARVRCGIGRPPGRMEVAAFVLQGLLLHRAQGVGVVRGPGGGRGGGVDRGRAGAGAERLQRLRAGPPGERYGRAGQAFDHCWLTVRPVMAKDPRMVRRSRARRLAESVYGLLLLIKAVVAGALVVAVLAAGVWVSWGAVKDARASGFERGTMTVSSCGTSSCSGPFTAGGDGSDLSDVRVDRLVTTGTGQRFAVAVKPGTTDVVRTGFAGVLFALRSVAGALLLAALALGFGLGLRRVAWATALLGAVLVAAPFGLG